MRIAIGADHAGWPLKEELVRHLRERGHDVLDLGTHGPEPVDYPDVAAAVAEAVRDGRADRGIVVCGSGAGACIAANKLPGIRAATCHDTYTARQAVEHDDANVLCLGARVIGVELAREIVDAWANARFTGEERHRRRLGKILDLERRYNVAEKPD
jgi:ribose 5-phosphate isomerase B